MIRRAASIAVIVCAFGVLSNAQPSERTFLFTYAFSVRNPEQGKLLRVWFPKAKSDEYQTVRVVSAKSDLPVRQTKESKYGNEMFYAEAASADKPEYRFEVVYEVTRRERLGFHETSERKTPRLSRAQLKRYTAPDRLVPTEGKPAEIARKVVQGKTSEVERARAIYDYVFASMRYDKSGTGWGHGDALWACDSHHGNCTDFHSLFASMARSQGIPTRFEIGFPLPADKHEGEIPGYHCWADFYLDGKGWIPVDISEAWKHPEKKDYYFGAHDANRVQFSMGRDLILSPKQDGAPLNYFVYPYAESDGKELLNIRNDFSFRDRSDDVKQVAIR